MTRVTFISTFAAAFISLTLAMPTLADTGAQAQKILEAMPEFRVPSRTTDTHPIIRITPAKPWLLRLEGEAADISVDNNSAGLRVVRYDRKSVALLSKGTGAAHITVKDANGGILMSRGVLIPKSGQKYVRIATGCDGGKTCTAPARLFYCPNLCYETTLASAGLK
ncbi:MAG: hypothetical protein ACAH83_17230 [Alphaproteobacteria bacterium]